MDQNNLTLLLQKAKDTVKRADEAAKHSEALLQRLEKEHDAAEKENQSRQKELDKKILSTIQKLDEDTLRFIKATE